MATEMKLGSSDWNLWPLTRDYDELFSLLKSLNILNVELGIYQPSLELDANGQKLLVETARKYGITITAMLFSLTETYWPVGAFSNLNSQFLSEARFFLEACQAMHVDHANIWTGVDQGNCDRIQIKTSLNTLDKMADSFDGIVSIEYKAETIFSSGKILADFLSSFRNLKVLIDTGHAFALGEDVIGLIDFLNERKLLGAMHLGDALPGDSDADLPCGRIHDFTAILQKLKEVNFAYSMNFDLYGAAIDEHGPGAISILTESKNYIDELLIGIGT